MIEIGWGIEVGHYMAKLFYSLLEFRSKCLHQGGKHRDLKVLIVPAYNLFSDEIKEGPEAEF